MNPFKPTRNKPAPTPKGADMPSPLLLGEASILYQKAPINKHTLYAELKNLRTLLAISQPEMGELMGISTRKLSGVETGAMAATEDDVRRFNELRRLCAEIATLIKPEQVGEWLKTPSEYFGGMSAAQVMERGEIDRVWRLIWRVQDGVPLD